MLAAGFGKWELTPPIGVELAGYGYYLNRRALSVRDPLYARAVLLETDYMRSLVISCDLLGLSKAVCAEVFRHAQKLGIPKEHVMIVSTHTHTGPTIKYHEGCGFVDEAYVATVGGLICQAVDEALADLAGVTALHQAFAAHAMGEYVLCTQCRYLQWIVSCCGFTLCRHGKARICLINAACHGVFRGRDTAVSADFAGKSTD